MQEVLQDGASNLFLDFRVEIILIGYSVSKGTRDYFSNRLDVFHTSDREELIESTWKLDERFVCSVHLGPITFLHRLAPPVIQLKTLPKPTASSPTFV